MPTMKEVWDAWKAPETLEENVRLFFQILDQKEHSDNSGCSWSPTKMDFDDLCIHSCRVWDSHRLKRVFAKMKELVAYERSR